MAAVKMHAEAKDTKYEYDDAHRKIESGRRTSRSWSEKNLAGLGKINDIHQTERHA
jgi:YD repeat-containing protein